MKICAKALTRIGTPSVIHAIAEAFPTAEHHFRLYASSVLEHIHSDLAVKTCLALLEQEKDELIRQNLAEALLGHFAPEGIEIARQQLVGKKLDFRTRGLQNHLLETCAFTGDRFPEYDEWLATEKAEREEHQRRIKELEGDPRGLLLFALEKLTGKKASDVARPPAPPTPAIPQTPPIPRTPPPTPRLALPLQTSRRESRRLVETIPATRPAAARSSRTAA